MCQPSHSIVQFELPDNDNDDQNSGTPTGRLGMFLGNIGRWAKKIGGMFHVSMMGMGHSEALGEISGQRREFFLPKDTKYESHWWNRTFSRDGSYAGNVSFNQFGRLVPVEVAAERKQLAFDNAKLYANQVSIGSLHSLRQFLETTLDKTDELCVYQEAFRNMLNKKGVGEFDSLIKRTNLDIFKNNRENIGTRESFKRICLGFTRKRHLLVPEWADDKSLWTPSKALKVPPTSQGIVAF